MDTHVVILLLAVIRLVSESLGNPTKSLDEKLKGSNQGKQLPGEEGGEDTVDIVLGDCDQCSCKLIIREETEGDNKCEKIMDIRCTCNGNHCTSKEISNCLADMADTSQ
uniref:Putative secreted peptide n=1 Tax=Rhipicephalus pulchellus TaxID=72859 RepID=L7M9V7_RHIPC